MNQTPPKVIYIVVSAIALLSFMGLGALCLSLFYKTWADPAILTALIAVTSSLTGSLVTLLTNTRSQPNATTTESSSTVTTTTSPTTPLDLPKNGASIPVTVTNASSEPVPVDATHNT